MRELSYRLHGQPQLLEYHTVIWTSDVAHVRELEQTLLQKPEVVHFSLSPGRN